MWEEQQKRGSGKDIDHEMKRTISWKHQCNDHGFVKLQYSRTGREKDGEQREKINLWGGVKLGTDLFFLRFRFPFDRLCGLKRHMPESTLRSGHLGQWCG